MIFSHDRILEIHQQAVKAGLHNKRDTMLMGMNADYVAGLNVAANPAGQLLSDLEAMNKIGGAVCGTPLECWLRNAAYDTRMQPDRQKFFSELANEAVKAVLPPSLAGIYRPIRDAFEISDLKAILLRDLKRDGADFSLFNAQAEQSVLCLLQETQKRSLTRELLEALRKARPGDNAFAMEIAKALQAFEQEPPDQPGQSGTMSPEAMLRPVETTDDLQVVLRKALYRSGNDLRPITVTTRDQEKFVGALIADRSDGGVALLGWFQLRRPTDDLLYNQLDQLISKNQLLEAVQLAGRHGIEPEMRNPVKTLSSSGALGFTADTFRSFPPTDVLQSTRGVIPGLENERALMWATP